MVWLGWVDFGVSDMSDAQDWDHWLSEILDKGVNLTSFETDFVESLETKPRPLRLSEKQAEILERIYSQRTP